MICKKCYLIIIYIINILKVRLQHSYVKMFIKKTLYRVTREQNKTVYLYIDW